MPEIIYRNDFDYREQTRQELTQYASVSIVRDEAWRKTSIKGEPMLVQRRSEMREGLNAHSGRKWHRWMTVGWTIITARENGPWECKVWFPTQGWRTELIFEGNPRLRWRVPVEIEEETGLPQPVRRADYYPLITHYERGIIGDMGNAPGEVMRALVRTDEPSEVTRRLFGKTRYRRDLVRAVAQTNITGLVRGWMFRGLCPTDWIVENMGEPVFTYPALRPVLRRVDQRTIKSLLEDAANFWELRDIREFSRQAELSPVMRGEVEIPRMRTWRDLHDWMLEQVRANQHLVATIRNAREVRALPPMELNEFSSSLEGEVRDLRIVIANSEDMLRDWSDRMGNCISGYGAQMRNMSSILGGVYRGDSLMANFELGRVWGVGSGDRVEESGYRITQLLGRFNQPLESQDRLDIENYLGSKGVMVPEDYWGRPARVMDVQVRIENGVAIRHGELIF